MADVIFCTHAMAATGFGHAARCAAIAGILLERHAACDIVFEGEFVPEVATWIRQRVRVRFASSERAGVGFYDRMDDTADPTVCDAGRVENLASRCVRTVFMASGVSCPALPEGIEVVGYAPGQVGPLRPGMRWSLDYAPVPAALAAARGATRDTASAFVALGGATGDAGVREVLRALAQVPAITRVDVLQSPVNQVPLPDDLLRPDQVGTMHAGVESVAPFLAKAGVVVASYGNLGYEAIGTGAPLCLVGQKPFQSVYAEHLARQGLCVAAGMVDELDSSMLAAKIEWALQDAAGLSQRCIAVVDGRGLERLADLLEWDRAAE